MDSMELIKNYTQVTRIPLQIIQDKTVLYQFPETVFAPNPAQLELGRLSESGFPVCYTTTLGTLFTGLLRWESERLLVLFGPAPLYPCSSGFCINLLQALGEPETRLSEFMHWIRGVPIYDSIRFQNMLHFLDVLLNDSSRMRICYLDEGSVSSAPPADSMNWDPSQFAEHLDVLQEIMFENQILSLVESGNVLELQKSIHGLFHQNLRADIHTLTADRYLKNIFIGANSIACRAAIRGGLSAPAALDLSDRFLAQIESCKSYDGILMLLSQMLITYTKAVDESRLPESDSPIVHKITRCIRDHVYEPLSPTDIALSLHMDLSYLCRHFKEQTGQTISACIHEVKITESKRLIRTTNLPLAQIAMQLGYSSQNYFHRIFKQLTGMTPKAYAKSVSSSRNP